MKLLASVLLASASVMAIQRRESDPNHNNMEFPVIEAPVFEEVKVVDPVEIEALEETTTPYEDHNVTIVHTTQSTIDHRTGYTIDIRTTAETTAPPEFTTPPETTAPPEECGEPVCGCNAEEMARWEHEMAEWKRDQERKLFVCLISTWFKSQILTVFLQKTVWKIEFNKWVHEYGSDDEIHHWEHEDDHSTDHHDDHDEDIDADIGWDIIQLLTEARFIQYSHSELLSGIPVILS